MPEYLYTDGKHSKPLFHRMLYGTAVICETCGTIMWRRPQAQRINWNGNRAVHEVHPNIKGLIDDAPRRRDEFAATHEAHERRTAK